MRVVVTGATGFVGKELTKSLIDRGHQVVVLTRNVASAVLVLGNIPKFQHWDVQVPAPMNEIVAKFGAIDAVINLMGQNIAEKRWSEEQKEKIMHSRTISTENLLKGIRGYNESGKEKLKVFISTSAVGIYGTRGSEELGETTEINPQDFLAQVCQQWEEVARSAKDLVERVAILRVGVVLGKGAGVMSKMLPLFMRNLGGKLGSGQQYMSWIHIQDLVKIYCMALEDDRFKDEINATAPRPVTNQVFVNTLAKVLHKWAFFPAPSFMLNLFLGEMSTMLVNGQRVMPKKCLSFHFEYEFPLLEKALKDIVS